MKGWMRVEQRRYRAIRPAEQSAETHPHLLPISASLRELDERYPHLAAVTRETWNHWSNPTMTMREFERQKGGGA